MRRLNRFTVVCVGVLLLAAPAAFACGELGSMATSRCPMVDAMAEISESIGSATGSTGTSICHDSGQMSNDCCDARSAPEPMQARSFESVKLLVSLEATDLQVVAPLAPAALPHATPAADAFHLHDLGRYTLFSSFLL
ncbi:MAG: hypothetical protein IH936_04685 [Acidobacteria bacterium]|nr:hypothetical protein [Acidobacteriota bacterium]